MSRKRDDKTAKTIALICTTRVVKSNYNKKDTTVAENMHDEIEYRKSEDVVSLSHCLINNKY